MNAGNDYIVCVFEDCCRIICQNNLAVTFSSIFVELNVIHTGKFMLVVSEKLSVFFQGKYVGVRIYARIVNLIPGKKCISNLIRGIGKH